MGINTVSQYIILWCLSVSVFSYTPIVKLFLLGNALLSEYWVCVSYCCYLFSILQLSWYKYMVCVCFMRTGISALKKKKHLPPAVYLGTYRCYYLLFFCVSFSCYVCFIVTLVLRQIFLLCPCYYNSLFLVLSFHLLLFHYWITGIFFFFFFLHLCPHTTYLHKSKLCYFIQ